MQAPGRFDGEELIEALAGIDAPGRVAPLRDFDEEATRRARELAADNLDASPTVIRREIAGFGRAYPRCSGMLATKRSSSTPPRRRSAADADTPARVRRLMRAAAEYGVVGTHLHADARNAPWRGCGRSAATAGHPSDRLVEAAGRGRGHRHGRARRSRTARRRDATRGDILGDGGSADLHEIIDVVKVVVQPVAEAAVPMIVGVVVDWLRRRRKSGKPEPEVVTIVDSRGAVISRVTRNPEGLPVPSTPARR